jgi:hypothetical protein
MSDDTSDDTSGGRRYTPVTAFDVSDENPEFLAKRLDAIQREMRDGFAQVMSALNRLTKVIEGDHVRDDDIEQRVVALEQPRRKAAARK